MKIEFHYKAKKKNYFEKNLFSVDRFFKNGVLSLAKPSKINQNLVYIRAIQRQMNSLIKKILRIEMWTF